MTFSAFAVRDGSGGSHAFSFVPIFVSRCMDIDGRMREGTPAIAEPEKTEYEIRRDLNVAFVRDAAKRAQGAAEDL